MVRTFVSIVQGRVRRHDANTPPEMVRERDDFVLAAPVVRLLDPRRVLVDGRAQQDRAPSGSGSAVAASAQTRRSSFCVASETSGPSTRYATA